MEDWVVMGKERSGLMPATNAVQDLTAKAVVAQNFDAVCVGLMSDNLI